MAHSTPLTPATGAILEKLAALAPRRLAVMHGSSFEGDGGRGLRNYAAMLERVLGGAGSE